jgi:tRNA-2-methylthio-N6-dimethylallyladenosine synthase
MTIVAEARELFENGYREVTLLGQNVNSYNWNITKKGEVLDKTIPTTSFAELMEMVAQIDPKLRVRFSTSHPKDMGDDVLHTIAKYNNICDYIHLPVQSGNSEMLKKMNRGYTREWFLNRIEAIRRITPNAFISTDIITGFCGETEEQHQDTISLLHEVKFSMGYDYMYSERPKTLAERKYEDDIPLETKKKRLQEVIDIQLHYSHEYNKKSIGQTYEVLIEKISKKSPDDFVGRNPQNTSIVFLKGDTKIGEYVNVKVLRCTKTTLIGEIAK